MLADAAPVYALPDGVDDARTIAVRNDPRERHPVSEPVPAFLRVAGVHAREGDPDAHLARAGLGLGHLPDLQDLCCRSRPFVPSCAHDWTLAKGAVDADLVQSALESGELLVVEFCDEQLRDAAHMNRSGLGEAGRAGIGQRHHDATPVGAGGASTNETLLD